MSFNVETEQFEMLVLYDWKKWRKGIHCNF